MSGLEAGKSKDRRITVHTDDGVQHYSVVRVERTSVPDTYRLHIDSSGGAWLRAGTYEATIHGKQRRSGSLALIDYDVTDAGILFVGRRKSRQAQRLVM